MSGLKEVHITIEDGIMHVDAMDDNVQLTVNNVDDRIETIHRMTPDGRHVKAERNTCLKIVG